MPAVLNRRNDESELDGQKTSYEWTREHIYTICSPLIGITNMDYVRFCLAWYETIKVLPSYIEFQWDLIYFVASTSEAR